MMYVHSNNASLVWRIWRGPIGRLYPLWRKYVGARTEVCDRPTRQINKDRTKTRAAHRRRRRRNRSRRRTNINRRRSSLNPAVNPRVAAREHTVPPPGESPVNVLRAGPGWVYSSGAWSCSRPPACTRCSAPASRRPRPRSGGATTKCRCRFTRTEPPKTRRPPRSSRYWVEWSVYSVYPGLKYYTTSTGPATRTLSTKVVSVPKLIAATSINTAYCTH